MRDMTLGDMRDVIQSLDERYRYAPTSRQYGEIMMNNRQKRAPSLAAARAKAKKAN